MTFLAKKALCSCYPKYKMLLLLCSKPKEEEDKSVPTPEEFAIMVKASNTEPPVECKQIEIMKAQPQEEQHKEPEPPTIGKQST